MGAWFARQHLSRLHRSLANPEDDNVPLQCSRQTEKLTGLLVYRPANPVRVTAATMAALQAEFLADPMRVLAGGPDGMAVNRVLFLTATS